MSIQNLQSNKCENCARYNKTSFVEGYCDLYNFYVVYSHNCLNFEEKRNNMNEEKTLLCDNCRFAEFKDNNDSFYCALYDQPIYADPHHLVCDHHSDHYKGFDSPRYVR